MLHLEYEIKIEVNSAAAITMHDEIKRVSISFWIDRFSTLEIAFFANVNEVLPIVRNAHCHDASV